MVDQGPHRLSGAPPSRSPGADLGRQPSLWWHRRLHPIHLQGGAAGKRLPPFRLLSSSGIRRNRRQRLHQHRGRRSLRTRRHQPGSRVPHHELPCLHRDHMLLPRLHPHLQRGGQSPIRVSDFLPTEPDFLDRGREQRGDHALSARLAHVRMRAGSCPPGRLPRLATDPGRLCRLGVHPPERDAARLGRIHHRHDLPPNERISEIRAGAPYGLTSCSSPPWSAWSCS